MLTKFSVTNFKGFNNEFVFDLKDNNGYTFNDECIKNGVVNNALIYGHNGVGKSNLAFAIFDIIGHLTDKKTNVFDYTNYLNAENNNSTAKFRYEFLINSNSIVYEYQKSDYRTILSERFSINDVQLASINREVSDIAIINFKGAETLIPEIKNRDLSLLKYIKNNSVLDDGYERVMFFDFFQSIDSMLFFRSLDRNMFLGLESEGSQLTQYIIENKKVKDFEKFLIKAGINCKLDVIKKFDKEEMVFDFKRKKILFIENASQGTKTLTLFYFWLQRLKENKVSFLFIDEFDAFYHHDLSALLVEELKNTGVQFVLTTHNTSIITNDLLRPDCYFLMKKDSIKSLAKSTSKELREAHNIEKMYKSGIFND